MDDPPLLSLLRPSMSLCHLLDPNTACPAGRLLRDIGGRVDIPVLNKRSNHLLRQDHLVYVHLDFKIKGAVGKPGQELTFMSLQCQVLTDQREYSEEKILMDEGCLTYPGLWLKVNRPTSIKAEWEDSKGTKGEYALSGLESRVFQHEYDHMEGTNFTERVSKLKLDMAHKRRKKQLRKLAQHAANNIRH